MHTIWKYELDIGEVLPVEMPRGAKVRYVGMQGDQLCVWAQVDSDQPLVKRVFAVHGTGHTIRPTARENGTELPTYLGTFMMYGGELVFHVFDHGEVT